MALTATVNLEITEQDYFLVVGPIAPSDTQRYLELEIDHWDGTPVADISFVVSGAALTTAATESLANMDAGVSLVWENPDPGATPKEYPGTTTVVQMYHYVAVGSVARFRLAIPAFTGDPRYVVVATQFQQWAGAGFPKITATIKTSSFRMFQPEFTEHSGALNNYRNFGGDGGYSWLPGSKWVILVGSDGNGFETHSMFPVAAWSADEDLPGLLAGTPLVPAHEADDTFNGVTGVEFTVPAGGIVRLEFALPDLPPTGNGWPMFYYVNDAPSDIHVSFVSWIERPPNHDTTLSSQAPLRNIGGLRGIAATSWPTSFPVS